MLFAVIFNFSRLFYQNKSIFTFFHFDLKQTRKNTNPGKNFFGLINTHHNDINRYKQFLPENFM